MNDPYLAELFKLRNAIRGELLTLNKKDFNKLGIFQTNIISMIDEEANEYQKVMNQWMH